eukprot:PRCOL_00005048-RA
MGASRSDTDLRLRCTAGSFVYELGLGQTLYVNNLNDRARADELRRALAAVFSQFGRVLDVSASKAYARRGQAWVCMESVPAAANALRQLQGFNFLDKPMRISFAKDESDTVAKLNGTYKPRQKKERVRPDPEKARQAAAKRRATAAAAAAAAAPAAPAAAAPDLAAAPNKILFVQNLPAEATDLMVSMLFQQFPGYKEVRMVEQKPGIAFVEFESDMQAGVAMQGLQGFKITPTNSMAVSYAKQ